MKRIIILVVALVVMLVIVYPTLAFHISELRQTNFDSNAIKEYFGFFRAKDLSK